MSLVSFSNVFLNYGPQIVLDGVSFTINRGDRVGLVGRNGSGKSTILRLITGKEKPERGSVNIEARLRIDQLEQDPNIEGSLTVAQAVLQGRPELVEMEKRLRDLEQKFGDPEADAEAVLTEYGDLQHEFDRLDGHEFHARSTAVLCGLGLPAAMHTREVGVLSGGQKTRLILASLLLSNPDMLLLDEPTNHLDLEATEWLQAYLQRISATILIVSHDRYLLDAVCDHVLEIENSTVNSYVGNYSAFLQQKEELQTREQEVFERQQKQVQKMESFIRRFRAGTRSTQAASREKALARMEIHQAPSRPQKNANTNLGHASRSGRHVVEVVNVSKQFEDQPLFEKLNLIIERGSRIGLVGPNGSGKTTFIRMIMGIQQPSAGTIAIGSNVNIGYFSQDFSTVEGDRTVLDDILKNSNLDMTTVRSMLGRFLFTDDEVFKSISDLSGGERNRMEICKLLLSRPNFVVLDEPTNHLDIATREGLIQSLKLFNGTMIVASHDRYLLDRVASDILEIVDGHAHFFHGNYSDYRRRKFAPETPTEEVINSPKAPVQIPKSHTQLPKKVSRQPAEPRQKKLSLSKVEKQIQELETRLAGITDRMNDPNLYKSPEMQSVVDEYDRVRSRIAHLYEQWSELASAAEAPEM